MVIRWTRRRALAVGAAAVLAVSACGGPSVTDTKQDSNQNSNGETGLAAVYTAVKGLTGKERYDKLLELAKKESGQIGFYHSGNYEEVVAAFEKQTGLKIGDFSATSERVAERVKNEKSANQTGSDVVILSMEDLVNLQKAGGVATPLQTPTSEGQIDGLKGDYYVSPIFTMDMPVYNKSLVPTSQLPKSWNDVFTTFKGKLALEVTAWKWYGDFVEKYLVGQQHLTEQQAIDLMTKGFKGAKLVDGNSLIINLLASGEFGYIPNAFPQNVFGLQKKGAPIDFAPQLDGMPVFYHNVPIALADGGKHPAGGLLFLEYFMSDEGQHVIASTGYGPASKSFTGETLLSKYPNAIFMDLPLKSADEQQKWKDKFDQLLRSIGTPVQKS